MKYQPEKYAKLDVFFFLVPFEAYCRARPCLSQKLGLRDDGLMTVFIRTVDAFGCTAPFRGRRGRRRCFFFATFLLDPSTPTLCQLVGNFGGACFSLLVSTIDAVVAVCGDAGEGHGKSGGEVFVAVRAGRNHPPGTLPFRKPMQALVLHPLDAVEVLCVVAP